MEKKVQEERKNGRKRKKKRVSPETYKQVECPLKH